MVDVSDRDRKGVALAKAAAVCLLSLAVAGAGYYWIAPTLRDSYDYPATVPARLEAGDIKGAARVAAIAAERVPWDPDAAYWYARCLRETGQNGLAVRELERLFAIDRKPNPAYQGGVLSDPAAWLPTVEPYFHPGGRAEMAVLATANSQPDDAVANAVLTNAYGHTAPDEYRPLLARIYQKTKSWGREYACQLPMLDDQYKAPAPAALLALAREAAARMDWTTGLAAADRLIASDKNQALLLKGKFLLAQGRFDEAVATLDTITPQDEEAVFFLAWAHQRAGAAPETVIDILSRSTESSPYFPFCVAGTITLLRQTNGDPGQIATLEDTLRECFQTPLELPEAYTPNQLPLWPLGVTLVDPQGDAATPQPLLVLWGDHGQPARDATANVEFQVDTPWHITVRYGARILDLRLLRNIVPYGDFQFGRNGSSAIPGWPDRMHLLSQTGDGPPRVYREGQGIAVETFNQDDIFMLRSMPLATQENHYLFAARCRSEGARLAAGWQWIDQDGAVVYAHNAFNQVLVASETWRTEFAPRPRDGACVQAMAGIYRDKGAAFFDDLYIFPLEPPATPEQ